MTDNDDRDTGQRRDREGDRPSEPDPIGSVLGLVDDVQRRIFSAGVKRSVDSVVSRPKEQEDVWGEAIRLEAPQPRPASEEVFEIVRKAAPEVAGHLGRAGLSLADAVGRTWGVLERSLEQAREEGRAAREAEERAARGGDGTAGGKGDGARP
ncbi:hypothetical protein IDM40_10265 [Nocardiopsis sp. HNM0947]|uniref:Excreted virulence factor EspC, type VII ESX diderm n=1 Tax=Nocardiopsis coralli TaxID=2772213 RepID=A0ABR9P5I3_9ACTN|nr:hypothetical protein [Nocardiopsis coralli]MBE2999082.1 hypothetical protein [Nocardiopsis coralli]